MADSLAVTLHASAAEVASGSAAAVDLWGTDLVETRRLAELLLTVEAISGVGASLAVFVETSPNGTQWTAVDPFTAQTAAGLTTLATGDLQRYARVRWTLTAGASATFTVSGTALEAWCTLAELGTLGAAKTAVSALAKADRVRFVTATTQMARGYVARRHKPPIIRVGTDVAQAVAKIASIALLTDVVGINPHTDANAMLIEEARAKEKWFRDVSNGLTVADVVDSTPETHEGSGAVVVTGTRRGWGGMTVF